jgi:hypothetical protein
VPYVQYGDKSGLKQIEQVIKLIKNCSEFIQLHSSILERESITSLIKLAETATNDDFTDIDALKVKKEENQLNTTSRKLIIPILRIFISLCSTPQFHWHLSKYNALDLLNLIREKDDDLISDIAKEVCEKVIDHSQEGSINLFSGKKQDKNSDPTEPSFQSVIPLVASDYNVSLEIKTISSEPNL